MYNSDHSFRYNFLDQELVLLPEKALFWSNANTLLISDIHLGKANHFRKSGIPIPQKIHHKDLSEIETLILKNSVKKVIFLGDLFHSIYNKEWKDFESWLKKFSDVEWHLVKGNHDILPKDIYLNCSIKLHNDYLIEKPFVFTHIPLDKTNPFSDYYNIAGHIHPSVRLVGKGRQRLSLPCFYFGSYQAVLPAFGVFTGKYNIDPEESCKIFAIADNKIISILN